MIEGEVREAEMVPSRPMYTTLSLSMTRKSAPSSSGVPAVALARRTKRLRLDAERVMTVAYLFAPLAHSTSDDVDDSRAAVN